MRFASSEGRAGAGGRHQSAATRTD